MIGQTVEERLHSSLARSSVGPESHWVRLAIYKTEKLDMNWLKKEDGRHIFVVCKLWLRPPTFLVCEGGGVRGLLARTQKIRVLEFVTYGPAEKSATDCIILAVNTDSN